MQAVDDYIPTPERAIDKPFLMPIEDVFGIKGRGTVVTGRIERGTVKPGEEIEIVGMGERRKVVVTGVEMFSYVSSTALGLPGGAGRADQGVDGGGVMVGEQRRVGAHRRRELRHGRLRLRLGRQHRAQARQRVQQLGQREPGRVGHADAIALPHAGGGQPAGQRGRASVELGVVAGPSSATTAG